MVYNKPLVKLSKVRKIYKTGAGSFPALNDIDMVLFPGELITVVGKSGDDEYPPRYRLSFVSNSMSQHESVDEPPRNVEYWRDVPNGSNLLRRKSYPPPP